MRDIRNEFVPYELALRMKVLGFDEPCFDASDVLSYSQKDIAIPLFQQAFRWFDANTKYSGFIVPSTAEGLFSWWIQHISEPQMDNESIENFFTREEAELACLEKLCEIVENRKKDEK